MPITAGYDETNYKLLFLLITSLYITFLWWQSLLGFVRENYIDKTERGKKIMQYNLVVRLCCV